MANTKNGDHVSTPPKIHGHLQAGQTQCRNIVIHGYCKFADKGCVFKHDGQNQPSQSQNPPSPAPTTFTRKLNAESPSFTPSFTNLASAANSAGTSLKSSALSPKIGEISPFIPKSFGNQGSASSNSATGSPKLFSPDITSASSSNNFRSQYQVPDMSRLNMNSNIDQSVSAPLPNMDYNTMQIEPMLGNTPQMDYGQYQQDMYYSHASTFPLNYHLYAPSSGTDKSLASYQRRPEDFFISNNLREELQRKNEATLQTLPGSNLPEYVHVYHSLVPIETNMEHSTQVFGYPTWAYKATSSKDGRVYCLRRIVGYRLTNEKAISIVQVWNSIKSPSIVGVVEAFTTRAFGDSSLVFVYEYFPLAKTLEEVHFGSEMYQQMNRIQMSEGLIWRYIVQIASAVRSIHGAGLAARQIEPKRILVTGHSRIRLNCCGIFDILNYDLGHNISELQKEDITSLGKIVLMLANNSVGAALHLNSAVETIERVYSKDLSDLIKGIFVDGSVTNVDEVVAKSAPRLLDSFNDTLDYNTYLENELSKTLENGRVARLLIKFGMINERPEYDHDPAWSETGERYPIKLFRDFLFHQEDDNGKPVVDMGHVLRHLNKLDAGIEESIMLVSRDEQTCLLITYKELKACVESAFRELSK